MAARGGGGRILQRPGNVEYTQMSHRRFHWLEKTQVQLATVAVLAFVYFIAWKWLTPWDPLGPITFIAYGSHAPLAKFAAMIWILAALAAVITVTTRPESALLVTLIGAGAVSLRSPSFHGLLWAKSDNLRAVFADMIMEMVILAAVLLVAAVIIDAVRALIRRINPGWTWRGPIAETRSGAGSSKNTVRGSMLFAATSPSKGDLLSAVRCMGLSLAMAVVLVLLLSQSDQRGQIIFAVFVACGVAVLVAHQMSPTPQSIVAWSMPMLLGIILYILAAMSSVDSGANAWISVKYFAQALPVDWLTAGAGGGALGYWISERLYELKHIERQEQLMEAKRSS
jgi:hypothetical protein